MTATIVTGSSGRPQPSLSQGGNNRHGRGGGSGAKALPVARVAGRNGCMNHGGDGGSWKMWLPMIICCVAMIGIIVLVSAGIWSIR